MAWFASLMAWFNLHLVSYLIFEHQMPSFAQVASFEAILFSFFPGTTTFLYCI
jgi:hypothetical protein